MLRNRYGSLVLALPVMAAMGVPAWAADTPTQQGADQWRASKLVGVSIYGPDDKSVGKIDDVIMAKDGKAQLVVVGVGGFLGIGQKDVAIPYEQVKFSDQPVPVATPAPAPASGGAMQAGSAPAASGGAMSPGTGTPAGGAMQAGTGPAANGGAMAPGAGAATQPAAPGTAAEAAPRSTSYPDHGKIDMTYDQLKSAPEFKFAS